MLVARYLYRNKVASEVCILELFVRGRPALHQMRRRLADNVTFW